VKTETGSAAGPLLIFYISRENKQPNSRLNDKKGASIDIENYCTLSLFLYSLAAVRELGYIDRQLWSKERTS